MSESPTKPATGLLRWIQAIADSSLPSREKSLLFAYARFADWNTGECFASVRRLCDAAGLTRRTVQEAKRILRSLGALRDVGTDDSRVVIDIAVVERMTRAVNAPPRRTTRAGGAQQARTPSAADAPKPSIQLSKEQTNLSHHGHGARAGSWMDGSEANPSRLRECLAKKGVKGANLEKLCTAGEVSVEDVETEWSSICSDPKVRARPAVLAARLMTRCGIERSTRRPLDPELRAQNEHFLRLRQNRR